MSQVSASDLQLFGALSNPISTRPITADRGPMPPIAADDGASDAGSMPGQSDAGHNDGGSVISFGASEDGFGLGARLNADERSPRAPIASPCPSDKSASQRSASARSHKSDASEFARSVQETMMASEAHRSTTPVQSANIFGNLRSSTQALADTGDELLAKQQALLELERLRRQGVSITRNYTVHDRIEDIEFEVKRHCMHLEEETTLNFMRDSLKIAFGAIELANNKLGPWLDLDGWSTQMTSQMGKWYPALARIYRKYCRRSSMSPEAEIVLGVVSSIGMHHCRRKFTQSMATDMGFVPSRMPRPSAAADTLQDDDQEGLPPSVVL